MVFGLIGFLFNLVTFPGILVNGVIQTIYDERFGVPSARLAVDEDVDLDEIEQSEESLANVARILDDGEDPKEGERTEWLTNYRAVDQYGRLFKIILYPLLVTTIVGAVFLVVTAHLLSSGMQTFDDRLWLLPFWLGFSITAHAFPNQDPTNALWDLSRQSSSPLRFLGYPVVGLSKLFNALQFLWVDALYALGVWIVIGFALGVYPN